MGDPRRRRKKYNSPGHPYQRSRLETELVTVGRYGLRNKRELWRARTRLGNFRSQARSILALEQEEREAAEETLVNKLRKLGIVEEGTTSDEILGLDVEVILNRRLQTLVLEKGLAASIHHARQLIAHRHIAINGRVMTSPGYLVPINEEEQIEYAPSSALNDAEHPARNFTSEPQLLEIPKQKPGGRRR
jgi:small subunit ribosomal protein S4